jgi:glycosyltransferase involved in cell wall biosynthesis
MSKISVCLATFNEEKNIKDCLESVKWANEIVIVDGTSSDKTVEIAKKYTSKIIVRENPLMFHINKQKAFEAATGDWILYLDADERVTPELKKEVQYVIRNTQYAGFWIPRKNIIFGKWIRHTGWHPDYQMRLFKRGKACLPCKSVHEQPRLSGKAGYLKNPLIHYNYQTVSQFVKRLNDLYTENDKNVILAEGKKIYWFDATRFPVNEFLKRFFKEEGYKDGLHGLILSILQAFSAFITFAKVWEIQGFKEFKEEKFLEKTAKELFKVGRELRYWFLTSRINEEKNLLKNIVFKIKRRLGRTL